jgi:hypothetical protein
MPRAMRIDTTDLYTAANKGAYDATKQVGIGWSTQVQPILDAHCTSCHNGTPGAANPSYTITDPTGAQPTLTWTFDLRGQTLTGTAAKAAGGSAFSASYFSMAGPDMESVERDMLMISGDFKVYINPTDARDSIAIQLLNPLQMFPKDGVTRAFATAPHLGAVTNGADELTADEIYTLVLAADMGANYFARENKP